MDDPMLVGPTALASLTAMKRSREDNDADDLIKGGAAPVKRARTVKAGKRGARKTSTKTSVSLGTPAQATIDLVPVAKNPRVLRCLRCRSFVSKNKAHGMAECDQVLRNKANPQQRRRSSKFRMTPNRRATLIDALKDAAKGRIQEAQIERRLKTLQKWVKKTDAKGRLSNRSKAMFKGLVDALEVDYDSYNKKFSALKRKVGVQ